MNTAADLIGTGWAYPTRVGADGAVALAGGTQEIEGAIRCILDTRIGERVLRPEFGSRIWESMFEPVTARTLGAVEQATREAITRWEPRIVLESVDATAGEEDGLVLVEIRYSVRATNDRRNLVYPFYTIPRENRR
ncbi:MAG: GPW/gp25 family protein [Propionibacteriaceae bacterium]|nr:GPW/gp25 family protein [Propionibacteriaceae bacterium]